MLKLIPISFEVDAEAEKVTLFVADASYVFDFDFTALHVFYLNRKFLPHFQPMGLDPMNWAVLTWVGLVGPCPELKIEDVFLWYRASTTPVLYEATWKAFTFGMPEPEEAKQKTENPPSA